MPDLILQETPAGYSLFQTKSSKVLKSDLATITKQAESLEGLHGLLSLRKFVKFDSSANALEEITSINASKVPPKLLELLKEVKVKKKSSLAVADSKLANAINKLPDFDIATVSNEITAELYRSLRTHISEIVPGLTKEALRDATLGLAHTMSRHALKFSPAKIDQNIIQSIALLDEMDKELNLKAMRVKEWYGWHFPELSKLLNDNLKYATFITNVGLRTNTRDADLLSFLPEELEAAVKGAAEISMGPDMAEEDLQAVTRLAEEVIALAEMRAEMTSYLNSRMAAMAPSTTEVVGPMIGAKLIAKAGSLNNLAKSAGSTVQILGAEKAFFRALKTKKDTPKYGIIYNASLVGQAVGKNKGKIARMLAAKVALCARHDALSVWGTRGEEDADAVDDEAKALFGIAARTKIENRIRVLEGRATIRPTKGEVFEPAYSKFEVKKSDRYNSALDGAPAPPKIVDVTNGDDESQTPATKTKSHTPVSESKSLKNGTDDAKEGNSNSNGKANGKEYTEQDFERFAEANGISISKFKRKFERGDFEVGKDGIPRVLSKKELKKKRKHGNEEEEGEPRPKKKKKSKSE